MRKYQTSIAIGFFLGVVRIPRPPRRAHLSARVTSRRARANAAQVSVMSQQMLIIGAIFAGEAEIKQDNGDDDEASADTCMAIFAIFLFAVYSVFAVLLAVFRNDLIRDEALEPDDPALAPTEEAPPAPV